MQKLIIKNEKLKLVELKPNLKDENEHIAFLIC